MPSRDDAVPRFTTKERGTKDTHIPRYTSMRGQTTDGADFQASGRPIGESALRDLQLHAGRLWELIVKPLPPSEVATIRKLLQGGMPQLEHLRIDVEAPNEVIPGKEVITQFDLPPEGFPSLRSLVLIGSAASLTPPLTSHMRSLIMINTTQTLPLVPFLTCMRGFGLLEELDIANCFPANAKVEPQGDLGPFSASRLVSVKIEDYPHNISAILSAVIIPAHADVHLRGNLRGGSTHQCCEAFTGMLPTDRSCLPVLRRVSDVGVRHPLESCYISGKAGSGGLIDLELITDALGELSMKHVRGELFEGMVRTVADLFTDALVQSLEFVGDVQYVPASSWIGALARFPGLRRLEVDDVDLRASPLPVVSALMNSTRSPPGSNHTLCDLLEDLTIYGDVQGIDVVERICRCLESRKARGRGGRAVLRNLHIELYGDEALPEQELEHYQELLPSFAERTIFKIYVEPGDRSSVADSASDTHSWEFVG